MKKHLLYIALILSLFFSSCDENKNKILIIGSVINAQSEGVGDVNIIISCKKIVNGVYNSNFVDIGTYTTDAEGDFSISFDNEQVEEYRFVIHKTNYLNQEEIILNTEFIPGEEKEQNFTIYPEGTLRLKIKNQSPGISSDQVTFKITMETDYCTDCCPTDYLTGKGAYYDSIVECTTAGEQWAYFYWLVKNDVGTNYSKNDSIYLDAFQTTEYTIAF